MVRDLTPSQDSWTFGRMKSEAEGSVHTIASTAEQSLVPKVEIASSLRSSQ
jgi:hypothetical protein